MQFFVLGIIGFPLTSLLVEGGQQRSRDCLPGWSIVAKRWKTCVDLRANFISTKVSASHRNSTQAHTSPGQTESQVDPSFQLAPTCDSVWPGFNSFLPCYANFWDSVPLEGNFLTHSFEILELRECRELADPVDGYKLSDGYNVVGSIIRFACNPGCMLYGSSARVCGKDGKWSGTQPYCK